MIIDRIGSVPNQIITDKTAGRTKHSGGADSETESGTHATLSAGTVAVGSLVEQAMRTPPVREGQVDSLRASVASGNYSIDVREIASAIVKDSIG